MSIVLFLLFTILPTLYMDTKRQTATKLHNDASLYPPSPGESKNTLEALTKMNVLHAVPINIYIGDAVKHIYIICLYIYIYIYIYIIIY